MLIIVLFFHKMRRGFNVAVKMLKDYNFKVRGWMES